MSRGCAARRSRGGSPDHKNSLEMSEKDRRRGRRERAYEILVAVSITRSQGKISGGRINLGEKKKKKVEEDGRS